MSNETIRVILVDDHPAVRLSIQLLLETNPVIDLVAVCEDGHEAINQVILHKPDILLVDINMSPLNGYDVTETVLVAVPALKVIGFSINNQPKFAIQLLELGAHGYLTKTSPHKEILQGIIDVHNGQLYICHEIRSVMDKSDYDRFHNR